MVNRLIDMYNQTGTDFLQRVLGKGFRKVSGVLRGILPTSLTCKGIIGTGDPAGTGKVFMIVSFVRMLLRENNKKTDISLEPDMDHACLQVEAGIKGRLFLFNILVLVMWFLTDRDMVRMRKAMKKGKSNKGKSKKEESEQEKSEQGGSGEGKELNDERE
jgi:hypothetical protein